MCVSILERYGGNRGGWVEHTYPWRAALSKELSARAACWIGGVVITAWSRTKRHRHYVRWCDPYLPAPLCKSTRVGRAADAGGCLGCSDSSVYTHSPDPTTLASQWNASVPTKASLEPLTPKELDSRIPLARWEIQNENRCSCQVLPLPAREPNDGNEYGRILYRALNRGEGKSSQPLSLPSYHQRKLRAAAHSWTHPG